jgi:hypothetical protein
VIKAMRIETETVGTEAQIETEAEILRTEAVTEAIRTKIETVGNKAQIATIETEA